MDAGCHVRRVIEVAVILAQIVTVQVSTADAQTVKFTPAKGTPADGEQLTVAEALDGRVTIDFDDEVPLDEAVDALKAAVGIEIQFSVDALDETGIGEKSISFRLANITLRSALNHLLRQVHHGLTYTIQNEVLMIVTQDESDQQLVTKFYDVDDLLRSGDFVGELPRPWIRHVYHSAALETIAYDVYLDQVDVDSLIEAITSLDPSSWDEVGGPG